MSESFSRLYNVVYSSDWSIGGDSLNDLKEGYRAKQIGFNFRVNFRTGEFFVVTSNSHGIRYFYISRIAERIYESDDRVNLWQRKGGFVWKNNYTCRNLTNIIREGSHSWNILKDLCKKSNFDHNDLFTVNRTSIGSPTKNSFKEVVDNFLIAYRMNVKRRKDLKDQSPSGPYKIDFIHIQIDESQNELRDSRHTIPQPHHTS
jgi:hypothetical protein